MQRISFVRVLAASLLGAMTIPVATQRLVVGQVIRAEGDYAIFYSQDDDGRYSHGQDIREDVIKYQSVVRAKRRAYTRAIDRCRDRLRDGEEIECPDINDTEAYNFDEPAHAAAVVKPSIRQPAEENGSRPASARSLIRELSTPERELLRTNTRAGFCKISLGDYLYDLCRSIVGEEDASLPTGIINDNVYLHSRNAAPSASLKLRLKMVEEAVTGSRGRRTGVPVPMRYQGGLKYISD